MNTIPRNSMSLNAEYGNSLVSANDQAMYRGSGHFNPPPLFEETTDRGAAYSQAANFYIDNSNNRPKLPSLPSAPLPDYAAQIDQWNKNPYVVGTTGFHAQTPNSWDLPNIDGNPTRYEDFASKATQLEPNTLMSFFFSPQNVNYLQQKIVDEVKKIKKVEISKQSEDELLIIMNNHFQRALNGWLPREDKNAVYPRGANVPCSLTERLRKLNQSVLEECVKQILSSISMYLQYYMDASSLPDPLDRPTYTSMKGSRVLSEPVGIYDNPHQSTRAINSFNERNNIL